jgi:hypothetical protein
LSALSAPFLSFGKSPVIPELQDLYNFIESKQIYNPVNKLMPFKLFPFQKQILKEIHENQFILFIQARQIGMTSLIAGYTAWIQNKLGDKANYYNISPNCDTMRHFVSTLERMSGKLKGQLDGRWGRYLSPNEYTVVSLDNENWDRTRGYFPEYYNKTNQIPPKEIPLFLAFLLQLTEELRFGLCYDTPSPGKIIVTGTPDCYGNLERAVAEIGDATSPLTVLNVFKVFKYNWNDCRSLWTKNREHENF